jgi:two-component system, OmpR family, phosphate regulon response regulator PhoB
MSKQIWILDDDFSIGEALTVVLEDVGHKVHRFETGKDLMSQLEKELPDILLMDVLLTNENGIDIAQSLKTQPQFENLTLIIMSANKIDEEDIKRSRAKAFLRKPFDIYDLVDLVNTTTGKK